jgi:hypothetical protein
MIECRRIDSSFFLNNFEQYKTFLVPSALFLFKETRRSDAYLIVIEALKDDKCIALILAEAYQTLKTAQLYSIFVQENFRQRGVGFALFRSFQELLVKEEFRAIGFEYMISSFSLALEKILEHLQWPIPKLYLIRYYYDDVSQFKPPWIFLPYHIPSSIEIFPWTALKPEEKKLILFQEEQGVFLPQLSPFREESQIEYLNSLGLRYQGKVIGWAITHRIKPDTIRYTTLYIEKEFYHLGYAIFLLIQSMLLHKKSPIPKALFEVNLREIEPSWARFIQRRLKPYADRIEKVKWAFKAFNL